MAAVRKFFRFTFIISISTTFTTIAIKLPTLTDMFSHNKQEIEQREYPLDPQGTLTIITEQGNIAIQSTWQKPRVLAHITKIVPAKENTQHIVIIEDQVDNKHLSLKTCHLNDKKKSSSVDFALIVPNNITIHATTGNGSITIKDTQGTIVAQTENGSIEVTNHDGIIETKTNYGNIVISNPKKTVNARTASGNITIENAHHGITTKTKQGNISISCASLEASAAIKANTDTGSITLLLPEKPTIDLDAKTEKGSITCDYPIITRAKEFATISKEQWNYLKKNLEGSIGNKADKTHVSLSASTGKITIHKQPYETA